MADGHAVQEIAVVVRNLYEITRHPNGLDQNATINSMRNIMLGKISLFYNCNDGKLLHHKMNFEEKNLENKRKNECLLSLYLSKNGFTITRISAFVSLLLAAKAFLGEELQKCRQLALQIANHGATLYDLLGKEVIARNERNKALSFSFNLSDGEKAILQAVQIIQEELSVINHNLQNVSSDEAALDAKIERRKKEYDQQQKRLAKLQSFRPQCMDEYEKYEMKLKQLYAIYVLKFRNVAFLQGLQNEFDHAEQQRNADAEQNMRNMVERMRAQELILREAQ
ncbi:hypothetical protein LOAG_10423 [Loa loa]|uniref:Uncharacterized protein n=1 Tax=Loa loa TaxID=7209 RepID=A0A1S0TPW8_LOALO|nr:hypothetical protein LOAG_10423 [Loa loa]EFO18073.2 hypothetical protein LOAG_10423 [Loa loa]